MPSQERLPLLLIVRLATVKICLNAPLKFIRVRSQTVQKGFLTGFSSGLSSTINIPIHEMGIAPVNITDDNMWGNKRNLWGERPSAPWKTRAMMENMSPRPPGSEDLVWYNNPGFCCSLFALPGSILIQFLSQGIPRLPLGRISELSGRALVEVLCT